MKLFHFDVKVGNWRVLTNTHDIADGAVTFDKIGNGAVTGSKIQDGAVEWKKLSPDLQNIIASAGKHGVALSNEFGDSELIGISQKTLTEFKETLGNIITDETMDELFEDSPTDNIEENA